MGRKRRPAHLKLLAGTLRPDRERPSLSKAKVRARPALRLKPGTGRTPPAPSWLPQDLHVRWRRYCRLLIADRRASAGHLDMLGVYLALDRQITAAFARGELPKNSHLARHERLARMLGLARDEKSARTTSAARRATERATAEGEQAIDDSLTGNRFHANWEFARRRAGGA